MKWVKAVYRFAGFFSYRVPDFSSQYALSSPVPGPSIVKPGLISTGIEQKGDPSYGEILFGILTSHRTIVELKDPGGGSESYEEIKDMESEMDHRLESSFRPLMTVSDLAHYLAVSKSMIYKLVDEGEVPHIKIGKSVRFKREDIETWIESRRFKPRAPGLASTHVEQDVDNLLKSTRIEGKI
jgi:CRISPR-associated Cas5-like protein